MPYIGKSPVAGGFHKLDNLTASATDTYALTLGSAAYYPESANQLLVSLNGVIQAPQDSFTVSGSNIVFDSALTASDSIDFIVALGDVIGVGSVTDGAITAPKIGTDAVTTAKIQAGAVTAAKVDPTLHLSTIKDSSGTNTGIAIDSSGIVTTPQRPMFQVRASSSTYKTTSGNVAFNLVDLDVGSNFNTSTYTFTAPVTGHYYMHSHLYSKIVSGSDVVSKFYVNGSGWVGNAGGSTQYMTYAYNNAGGEAHESVDNMAIMYLSASSTVTVNITPSGSSGVFEGAAETWWLGYLIG